MAVFEKSTAKNTCFNYGNVDVSLTL